jgi:hypothetical protein
MRSISRLVVAVAFVLALTLSTVPAQAQPREFGSSSVTADASWLEVALGWVESLLGGSDSATLQGMETDGTRPTKPGGNVGTMSGSCLDPWGNPCGDNG